MPNLIKIYVKNTCSPIPRPMSHNQDYPTFTHLNIYLVQNLTYYIKNKARLNIVKFSLNYTP